MGIHREKERHLDQAFEVREGTVVVIRAFQLHDHILDWI